MMKPPAQSILVDISSYALDKVWNDNGCCCPTSEREAHIDAISKILRNNLSNGRARYALEWVGEVGEITEDGLKRYGLRVTTYYYQEHKRINCLVARDKGSWDELRKNLQWRAYHTLCKRTRFPPAVAIDHAQDYAQEACWRILCSYYPYDVPFDAWATRILNNFILESLDRSTDLLDRGTFLDPDVEDLNSPYLTGHNMLDSSPQNIEARLLLLDAVERLPTEKQRQVILLGYFQDWNNDQIAEALDTTSQAVYNLRFRALRKLKEILDVHEREKL